MDLGERARTCQCLDDVQLDTMSQGLRAVGAGNHWQSGSEDRKCQWSRTLEVHCGTIPDECFTLITIFHVRGRLLRFLLT